MDCASMMLDVEGVGAVNQWSSCVLRSPRLRFSLSKPSSADCCLAPAAALLALERLVLPSKHPHPLTHPNTASISPGASESTSR